MSLWLNKVNTGHWKHYQEGKGQGYRPETQQVFLHMKVLRSELSVPQSCTGAVSHLHMMQNSRSMVSMHSMCS